MKARTCKTAWVVAAFLTLPVSGSNGQTTDLDALYARAAMEGEVSIYLQGPPQVYAGLVREFEAKYPKLKVRITPGRYDLVPRLTNRWMRQARCRSRDPSDHA